MWNRRRARWRGVPSQEDLGSYCDLSLPATSDAGGRYTVMDAESALVLSGRGLKVRLVFSGARRPETYSASTRFEFGEKRIFRS